MRSQFLRNTLFALILFVVIGLISQINLPITQPVEEYLAFVLTTDMSLAPVVARMDWVDNLAGEWDLSSLLQGLPRISTGR